VLKDPTLADSSFTRYGDVSYSQLAAKRHDHAGRPELLEQHRPGGGGLDM